MIATRGCDLSYQKIEEELLQAYRDVVLRHGGKTGEEEGRKRELRWIIGWERNGGGGVRFPPNAI